MYILIGIIIILCICVWIICKNIKTNTQQNSIGEILRILIRQSSRWSIAASQDKSPLIAVLHANYGAGYLWAIKDIASSEQLKQATGVELLKFEKEITKIQDATTKRMVAICPEYAGDSNKYLAKIAGEGI